MKEYSQIILAEKVVFFLITTFMVIVGVNDFKLFIAADFIGKAFALILGTYFCRDIIFCTINKKDIDGFLKESFTNIKTGIFLLVSNLSGLFITGVVQFLVEYQWSIEIFSKVALTFNMSKLLLVLITAISIVLVPVLKHMSEEKLKNAYVVIRNVLFYLLATMMIIYYPMAEFFLRWLPQYNESVRFLVLLFPMCLFESKTTLLINTYLKAMRKERILCIMNLLSVGMVIVLSYFSIFVLKDIYLTILIIPYVFAIRMLFMEYVIGNILRFCVLKEGLEEVALATMFIFISWNLNNFFGFFVYGAVLTCFVLVHKKNICRTYQSLKLFLNK